MTFVSCSCVKRPSRISWWCQGSRPTKWRDISDVTWPFSLDFWSVSTLNFESSCCPLLPYSTCFTLLFAGYCYVYCPYWVLLPLHLKNGLPIIRICFAAQLPCRSNLTSVNSCLCHLNHRYIYQVSYCITLHFTFWSGSRTCPNLISSIWSYLGWIGSG